MKTQSPRKVILISAEGDSPEHTFWLMDIESYEQFRIPEHLILNPDILLNPFSQNGPYRLNEIERRFRFEECEV